MNTIITQAIATGMPVVATRHSGIPEQVIDGGNGYLVAEGDPVDLAAKLRWCAEHPEEWARMGKLGREHAWNMYDATNLIGRQIAYYEKAVSEREDSGTPGP